MLVHPELECGGRLLQAGTHNPCVRTRPSCTAASRCQTRMSPPGVGSLRPVAGGGSSTGCYCCGPGVVSSFVRCIVLQPACYATVSGHRLAQWVEDGFDTATGSSLVGQECAFCTEDAQCRYQSALLKMQRTDALNLQLFCRSSFAGMCDAVCLQVYKLACLEAGA